MRKITIFLVITCISTVLRAQCADQSNIYSFTYNEKTYEVVKEMKNWDDACACAVERGGYLVEINDLDEQNAVYNAIINGAQVPSTYTSISNGGGIAYIWIGATDKNDEGNWRWDGKNIGNGINFWTGQGTNGAGNGASVNNAYFNWGGTSTGTPKEPDNWALNQHSAAIGLTGWPSGTTSLGIPGEWNDIIGSSLIYFVIEFDSSTGMKDIEENKRIRWYPNPTSGDIIIISNENIVWLEIYDISGNKIYHNSNIKTNSEISLTGLSKGIYIANFFNGKKSQIEKIVLQ